MTTELKHVLFVYLSCPLALKYCVHDYSTGSLLHCNGKLECHKYVYKYQVATALLVAGPTLTFWIPWQTQFD